MQTTDSEAPPPTALFVLLFVGSGCAALIYEVVWLQSLQLVIGSTAVSLGVLLGTFMGGMCIGSVGFNRIVPARWHPLRVYACLELGIGVCGLAILFALPYVSGLYMSAVSAGLQGLLLRGVVAGSCLLPPTILMGATLPAIARWLESSSSGQQSLGLFYGANIMGAVIGSLLAGFVLLRLFDPAIATYTAAVLNGALAILAWLATRTTNLSQWSVPQPVVAEEQKGSLLIYVVAALSGLTALAAEVVWTRILSLLLGATVYSFSIILAAFLIGLGIGSVASAKFARDPTRARWSLGVCQLALIPAVSWAGYCLTSSLPYWPIDTALTRSPWHLLQLDLLRCLWAFLPATCLWGASFPLAVASIPRGALSQVVGRMYAANTVGAIVGSLLFSMVAIPALGTQNAQRVVLGLVCLATLLVFGSLVWKRRASAQSISFGLGEIVMVLVALGLTWQCVGRMPAVPPEVIGYGRKLMKRNPLPNFTYSGEGLNASVAVSEGLFGQLCFHVSGKVVASSAPVDMKLQRLLGHLPAVLHKRCESILVVGCGAGVTAGSFTVHPSVKRIVICEIEPLIPQAAGEHFGDYNFQVMKDPRVEIVYDDARHYMATSKEKFDVITSDPIHPWVKGAASLYTVEYFKLCKDRLNPGGIVTQWVPLYESSMPAVKSQVGSFMNAFEYGSVWGNTVENSGYDVILLGSREQPTIRVVDLQAKLDSTDHQPVKESLTEIGLGSAMGILRTFAGQKPDLGEWLKDAPINRDFNLRLQYIAGLGLNRYDENKIYQDMLLHRRFPKKMIFGQGREFIEFKRDFFR